MLFFITFAVFYRIVILYDPLFITHRGMVCCKRFCKVIKMLAIHNYYEVVIRKDGKERVVGIYNENDYQELLKIYNETFVYFDVSEISDSELSILSKKYIENNQTIDGKNIAVFKKLKSGEKKFIGFYSKKDLFDVYSFIIEQFFNVIFIDKNELSKDEFKIVKDKYLNFENYEDKKF